jgi:hypothetical protein
VFHLHKQQQVLYLHQQQQVLHQQQQVLHQQQLLPSQQQLQVLHRQRQSPSQHQQRNLFVMPIPRLSSPSPVLGRSVQPILDTSDESPRSSLSSLGCTPILSSPDIVPPSPLPSSAVRSRPQVARRLIPPISSVLEAPGVTATQSQPRFRLVTTSSGGFQIRQATSSQLQGRLPAPQPPAYVRSADIGPPAFSRPAIVVARPPVTVRPPTPSPAVPPAHLMQDYDDADGAGCSHW